MIQVIKNWLYDIITSSGILYHLLPILKPWIMWLYMKPGGPDQDTIADPGGDTMYVTKYNGRVFPAFKVEHYAGMKNLKIREDDVFVCGYVKTGCHWMYEILHMLVTRKAELSKHGKILEGMLEAMPPILADSLPSPRVLNSHVLYEELPAQIREKKSKIIWTVRSPKDVVVSFYNHTKAFGPGYNYNGTFDNLFKLFMSGKMEYGSYFDYILAWERVMKTQSDNPILVVEYEHLKNNPVEKVKEVARFLDISVSDDFIHSVVEATNFNKMKEALVGVAKKILRKGQTGDWRNWLTDDQSAQIDQVWRERMSSCMYKPEL